VKEQDRSKGATLRGRGSESERFGSSQVCIYSAFNIYQLRHGVVNRLMGDTVLCQSREERKHRHGCSSDILRLLTRAEPRASAPTTKDGKTVLWQDTEALYSYYTIYALVVHI
jgi:hypothetical protein